jgi:hypothetical protein
VENISGGQFSGSASRRVEHNLQPFDEHKRSISASWRVKIKIRMSDVFVAE